MNKNQENPLLVLLEKLDQVDQEIWYAHSCALDMVSGSGVIIEPALSAFREVIEESKYTPMQVAEVLSKRAKNIAAENEKNNVILYRDSMGRPCLWTENDYIQTREYNIFQTFVDAYTETDFSKFY